MCKILMNPLVKATIGTMSDCDQFEINCLLKTIYKHPELGAVVKCMPGRLYQKTHSVTKSRYPNGLRIVYACLTDGNINVIAIEDMGDHRSCCNKPGFSIYLDERI